MELWSFFYDCTAKIGKFPGIFDVRMVIQLIAIITCYCFCKGDSFKYHLGCFRSKSGYELSVHTKSRIKPRFTYLCHWQKKVSVFCT